MIIDNELVRNDELFYSLNDENLDRKLWLTGDGDVLSGTPDCDEIENFAALTFFNGLFDKYISTFNYVSGGFLASYYEDGKFDKTFHIRKYAEDELQDYVMSECLEKLGTNSEDAVTITEIFSQPDISLFEAAMEVNYKIVSKREDLLKKVEKQMKAFDEANNNNCAINHELFTRLGVPDISKLLSEHIGPIYLDYRDYSRDFDKTDGVDGDIFVPRRPDILDDPKTYDEINEFCGYNDSNTINVLNAMSTDCSADMVAWGLRYISDTNEMNIGTEDAISNSYALYQNYFRPDGGKQDGTNFSK